MLTRLANTLSHNFIFSKFTNLTFFANRVLFAGTIVPSLAGRIMDDCQSFVSYFSCKLPFNPDSWKYPSKQIPGIQSLGCLVPTHLFFFTRAKLGHVVPLHDHSKPFQRCGKTFLDVFPNFSPSPSSSPLPSSPFDAIAASEGGGCISGLHKYKAPTLFPPSFPRFNPPSNASSCCLLTVKRNILFCPMQHLWWNYEWPKW